MNTVEATQLLGNIGEFIGAIGVLITLIYISVQIRQNTNATRAQIHQLRSDQAQDFFMSVALSQELSAILSKVNQDANNISLLSHEEETRYRMYMLAARQRFENMFYQHKSGFLSPELYKSMEKPISWHIPIWDALGFPRQYGEFDVELERIMRESVT